MRASDDEPAEHPDAEPPPVAARDRVDERDGDDHAVSHATSSDDPDRPLSHADLGARTGHIPIFEEHAAGPAKAFEPNVPDELFIDAPPAEAWAIGPDGQRMWGRYGAAGLLVVDRDRGVLLQHRAVWSHFGGTWGIPGGALERGESAVTAALREANEETGVDPTSVDLLATRVVDLGFWRYTTVMAVANRTIRAYAADAESAGVAWVQPREVARLRLHPGFGDAWPVLRGICAHRPALVIDVANVLGARGDGWWRDPPGAAGRLLERIAALAAEGLAARMFGLDAETSWPDLIAVLEGRGRSARIPRDEHGRPPRRLTVVHAARSGDDEIVAQVRALAAADPGRAVLVATSDRQLRNRVAEHGATAIGAGRMRDLLERDRDEP